MSEQSNTSEFLVLLRGGIPPKDLSAERMQYLLKRFQEWMGTMASRGQMKGVGRLEDAGKCIAGDPTPIVTDGPYIEAKEAVGGYFLVLASDLDAAVEIAKGCPLLENKGSVEVRPIQQAPGR